MEQQSNKSGMDPRVSLILLVLLFVVPVAAAIILHSTGNGWKTSTTTNWGNLVTPVRPVASFSATTVDNKKITREILLGKWTMLYIDSADCGKSCFNNLYTIRQSRLGMGGEKDRVQRIMFISGDSKESKLEKIMAEHKGMIIVRLDKTEMDGFLKTFEFEGLPPAATAERIYFIDPLGNLMMHYENNVSPKSVVKDLERLLKYSRIG